MQIKNYDPIIAILRSTLLANIDLTTWQYWTTSGKPDIYPAHISFYTNPNYPALTICCEDGQTLKNRSGYQELTYYIHGWFKPSTTNITDISAPSKAANLLNIVVDTLDVHPIFGQRIPQFAMCRLVDSRCPVYDEQTRTTFFMSQWLIKANKNLMYV